MAHKGDAKDLELANYAEPAPAKPVWSQVGAKLSLGCRQLS